MILCPKTVSRNLPVPRNLPKSSLNQPNRHKKSKWLKKKPNFIWPFFKNKKRPKALKKAKNYKIGLNKAKLATLFHGSESDSEPSEITPWSNSESWRGRLKRCF